MARRHIALAAVLSGSTACNAILGIQVFSEGGTSDRGIDTGVDNGSDASWPPDAEFRDADANVDVGSADSTTTDATPRDSTALESAADSATDGGGSTTDVTSDNSAAVDGTADSGADGPACSNACTAAATRCGASGVETCLVQPNGCTQWVATAACGAHQACKSTSGSAACVCNASTCTQGLGTVCQDAQTLATCAKDGDGCFYAASTAACVSPKSCSGMAPSAACSLTCTDSCSQGQTSCVSGSLTTCTLGGNGCWAYSPPVACGSHETCVGAAGAGACSCNQDQVCAAAGSVCTSASAAATCSADPQGCIYKSASATCTNQTCVNGQCSGVCAPTQTQCSGATPQTCVNGAWKSGSTCPEACTSGACTKFPSCQNEGPGAGPNCSASGTRDCCESLPVTGGAFYRTYTNSGSGPTGEADPATVSSFRLDTFDITVGRFRQFVKAWNSGWTPAAGSGKHTHLNGGQGLVNSGLGGGYEPGWVVSDNSNVSPMDANLTGDSWATWTPSAGANEKLPIALVNWWEAYAFCIWDGGFLPSEAEWEYAAAGGSQQREYPWGSTAPGTASQYAIYGCYYPSGASTCTNVSNVAPVGTATQGAGVWGQLDLAGNESQWNLDWYATYVDPCTDCGYFTVSSYQVLRGGIWGSSASYLPSARRDSVTPGRDNGVGMRCARAP